MEKSVKKVAYYTRRENGYWKDSRKVTVLGESQTRYKINYRCRDIWVSKKNVEWREVAA